MRLIDADVLMEKIVEYDNQNIQSPNRGTIVDVIDIISEMITEQPTAYDIDRVVEQLEEASYWTEPTYDEDGYLYDDEIEVVVLRGAIEIVESGGAE